MALNLKTQNILRLNDIFEIELAPAKGEPSPILKALACEQPSALADHVMLRLTRIGHRYKDDSINMPELRTMVGKRLLQRDWASAYSEFCALDFFLFPRRFKTKLAPPRLNFDVPSSRTYSEELGNKHSNVDLYFEWHRVHSDVKLLKDNVGEVFGNIYANVWRGKKRPLISHNYPVDSDAALQKSDRIAIRNALAQAASTHETRVSVPLARGVTVDFQLQWGSLQISEISFDPYRYAEELHPQIFPHAKKFVKDAPFLLTYVKSNLYHPYLSGFDDQNRAFYRAYSRRAFLQHSKTGEIFSSVCKDFSGEDTIGEVFRSLSGILFLEDDYSVDGPVGGCPADESGVRGFLFTNPNATHELSLFEGDIMCDVDDFRHDTY